jgi:hypothetical protein
VCDERDRLRWLVDRRALLACAFAASFVGCHDRPRAAAIADGSAAPSTRVASRGSAHAEAPVSSPSAAPAPEPDFDALPWATGDGVGYGIAAKDSRNPRGDGVLVAMAGWKMSLEAAERWATRLYEDDLRAKGVRFVYAVQGPRDVFYEGREIGLAKLARAIEGQLTDRTRFILLDAHSSGAYVAHLFLDELAREGDGTGSTAGKVVYFELDGGKEGLDDAAIAWTRRTYFVGAFDPSTKTPSPQRDKMKQLAAAYPDKSRYLEVATTETGCKKGATWCMHMAMITSAPHDHANADGPRDYGDFAGRAVAHGYIDDVAEEAGIVLP